MEFTLAGIKVVSGASGNIEWAVCGEVGGITAGRACYVASADNEAYHGDSTDSNKNNIRGIALLDANENELVPLAKNGVKIRTSTTLTVGAQLILDGDTTPGTLEVIANVATGQYLTTLGVPDTANTFVVNIDVSGVQTP